MEYSIEEVALKWLTKKKEYTEVLNELREIEKKIASIKEIEPLEREYAEIAGIEYKEELSELERKRLELTKSLQAIHEEQEGFMRNFFEEIKTLVLPLPREPTKEDGLFIFRYRDGITFSSTIATLEEILWLKPLVIGDVVFKENCLEVRATDEKEAKEKVISAIKELKLLAEVYLSPQLLNSFCERLRGDRYRPVWEMIASKTSITSEEVSKQTGWERKKVDNVCYDLTRKRLWKPFPLVRVKKRGIYELTLLGRIVSKRYSEIYGGKEKVAEQLPTSTSLNKFIRRGINEN
jgi:hypothetical protein